MLQYTHDLQAPVASYTVVFMDYRIVNLQFGEGLDDAFRITRTRSTPWCVGSPLAKDLSFGYDLQS